MNEISDKTSANKNKAEAVKVENHTTFIKFLPVIAILSIIGFVIYLCARDNQSSNSYETYTPTYTTNSNATPLPTSTPSYGNQLESFPEKTSRWEKLEYSYKTDGKMTIALFYKNFIPRNDQIFVAATKDVIKKSFKDDATGTPSLAEHDGQSKVRIDSSKYTYYILPVKQDTGEVHSLVISRELKP
jgi:hypothetical protein